MKEKNLYSYWEIGNSIGIFFVIFTWLQICFIILTIHEASTLLSIRFYDNHRFCDKSCAYVAFTDYLTISSPSFRLVIEDSRHFKQNDIIEIEDISGSIRCSFA